MSKWIGSVCGTALVLGVSSWTACSFDRSPREGSGRGSRDLFWDSESSERAGRSGGNTSDAEVPVGTAKANTGAMSGRGEDTSKRRDSDSDAGPDDEDAGREPERKPTQCKDEFCPIASEQVAACCTSQGDVDQHGARSVDACGMNLSRLDVEQYGSGCWQRDQLGIIDPRCPARGSEPGCCADDGLCGTSDPEHHLGCYHAKGAELRSCRQEMEPVGTVCDPRGSYALRITVDSAWNGRPGGLAALTDNGRGNIEIFMLVRVDDIDASSGEIAAAGRLCGVSLPPFYSSTLCESYQPYFLDSLWESPALPLPNLGGKYECAADGCFMSIWPTTYLFGIRLDNPEARWPTAQQTQFLRCPGLNADDDCFADDDADGEPGIAVDMRTEGELPPLGGQCRSYPTRAAPLSDSIAAIFGGVRRADRLQVGIRARVGGTVLFGAECTTAYGSAVVEYVNSRAKGCHVLPGSYDLVGNTGPAGPDEACRRDEASFIDSSMPEYRVLGAGESPDANMLGRNNDPSDGPTVRIVRFPQGAMPGCSEARGAMF